MPGLCGLLNHSLERSLRLVTPVSGLFIVVSSASSILVMQPSARQRLAPRVEMHLLQSRAFPGPMFRRFNSYGAEKTARPFSSATPI
jgi:hypothetical protein